MRLGIVGLPQSGKTNVFHALTGGAALQTSGGGHGQETHVAVVRIPDQRLVALTEMFHPRKTTPAEVQYTDFPGVGFGSRDKSEAAWVGTLRTVAFGFPLYAYGMVNDLMPTGTINSPFYAVVLVADDPSENDGDPTRDGADEGNPGTGVLAVRAEAFGPRGAHKVIELTVARTDASGLEDGVPGQSGTSVRILSWREVR